MKNKKNRIREIREEKGISGTKIAQMLSISPQYYYDIEKGKRNLSAEIVSKLSDIFNVSSDYLLGKTNNPSHYFSQIDLSILSLMELLNQHPNSSKVEDRVLEAIDNTCSKYNVEISGIDATSDNIFQQLIEKISLIGNNDFKMSLLKKLHRIAIEFNLIDDLPKSETSYLNKVDADIINETINAYRKSDQIKIPLLGYISAGIPITREENIEGYELVESETLRGRNAFCLRVKGDSMIGDGIYNGDTVVVVEQHEVTSSDIAVVAVNGEEATLKRVKCEDGMCILMPSNPSMQPQLVPAKKIFILGKVIQSRRNFE